MTRVLVAAVLGLIAGCGGGAKGTPDGRTTGTKVVASTPDAGPASLRKRKRTAAAEPHRYATGREKWPDLGFLNPMVEETHPVFVAPDDSCYYMSIDGAPSNAPSDPWRKVAVDCPPELDDPAWDNCVDGRLEGERGKPQCKCTGNDGKVWVASCPR